MSEQNMRQKFNRAMFGRDPVSVENHAYPGTPDVNFIEGWAELKWLRAWPAGASTIVRLEHLTQQQRIWLVKRKRAGGNVWLILQCRREWLCFNTEEAFLRVGSVPQSTLKEIGTVLWGTERLRALLSGGTT